jgi:transposase
MGTLTCTPKGYHPKFYLRLFKTTIHDTQFIRHLKELRRHIRGKLILLIDRLAAHRSKKTRAFLKTQRHWLRISWFPPYAPELNPVEYPWSYGKRKDLANFCPDTLERLDQGIRRYGRRLRRKPELLRGFLKASSLFR